MWPSVEHIGLNMGGTFMAPHLAGFCREQRKFQNSTNALVSLSVTLFGKDEPSDDPGRPGEPPPTFQQHVSAWPS